MGAAHEQLISNSMFVVVVFYCVQLFFEVNIFPNPFIRSFPIAFVSYLVQFSSHPLPWCLWCFYGMPMIISKRFPRDAYGNSMIILWDFYRISMGLLWDSNGMPMGFLWCFYRISIGFLWDFHDISIGFLLDSYGTSMICLWDFYVVSTVFLWDFYGIPMGFLCISMGFL